MSDLHEEYDMPAVRAVAEDMESKHRQLWVAVEQSDIAVASWNVVKIMHLSIDATFGNLSNLTLLS